MWSRGLREKGSRSVHRTIDLSHHSEKTLIGHSGRLSRLIFLSGVNIFPMDEGETLQVYRGIGNLIAHLPTGFGLQFRVLFRQGNLDDNPDLLPGTLPSVEKIFGYWGEGEGETVLSRDKSDDFRIRPLRSRSLVMEIVSYPSHERDRLRLSTMPAGTFFSAPRGQEVVRGEFERRVREIRQLEDVFLQLLPGAGMEGRSPTEEELGRYLFRLANPSVFGVPPIPVRNPLGGKKGEGGRPLFQTTFQEYPGELKAITPAGETLWGRFHALRQLPSAFHRETLAPILEGPEFDCDLTMNLFKPDRTLASRSIQSNATINRFLTLLLPGKSYRLESVIAEQDEFLRTVHEGPEEESHPCLVNLTLGYWHRERDSLSRLGVQILRAFGEAEGALCAAEPYRQWPLFRSQFPLDGDGNDRWEVVTSAQLARVLPVWDRMPDQENPWFFGKNHRQEVVGLDFWSRELPNANGLVLGRSGSGKSFGVKMLLCQYLLKDPEHHVVIVENGGDFERLAGFFGGDYIRIDLSGNFSLNPFPLKNDLCVGGDRYDPDWMGFLVALIETFLITAHPVLPVHRSILGQCLSDLYDRLPGQDVRPCLTDLVRTLFSFRGRDEEDEQASYEMAKTLEAWATGLYAPLFNNPSGFAPRKRILGFDLSGLDRQESLRGIVFAFIAGISLEKLFREKNRRLYFVYDEAHRLMTQFRGTGFLEHMYRTARKFGGGVVAMSQSPEDWLTEGREGGILGNSSWKWIFPCSVLPSTYQKIGLSDREIDLISSLEFERGEFSECYLSMGTRRGILRLEPSPLEYWMAAKSPDEDRIYEETLSDKKTIYETLRYLAEERWEERWTENPRER
ncbi:MAG: hypothetical protein VST70_02205 [Nitrospirota bacterium]|nr:hypothetical protein [Nitrospirota bacterium]